MSPTNWHPIERPRPGPKQVEVLKAMDLGEDYAFAIAQRIGVPGNSLHDAIRRLERDGLIQVVGSKYNEGSARPHRLLALTRKGAAVVRCEHAADAQWYRETQIERWTR